MNIHLIADAPSLSQLMASNALSRDFRVTRLFYRGVRPDVPAQPGREWHLVDLKTTWPQGLQLIERLRSQLPGLGIFVTGVGRDAQAAAEGYIRGADLFMNASIHHEELMAAADAQIRRQLMFDALEPHAQADAPCLELDASNMQLVGPRSVVNVTPTECKLLKALIQSHEKMLRTAEIVKMFGYEGAYQKRLSVLVHRVRKKIVEAGVNEKVIVAHRSIGYELNYPLRCKTG